MLKTSENRKNPGEGSEAGSVGLTYPSCVPRLEGGVCRREWKTERRHTRRRPRATHASTRAQHCRSTGVARDGEAREGRTRTDAPLFGVYMYNGPAFGLYVVYNTCGQ